MVIPDGSFIAGIPAEIKGPATKEQLFWTVANPAAYPGLAEQYKKEGL
jgi:carbonic anhydrase/acetyltransferase-like protein (isoleucine patch superfamily)